jgi:hypothetical protein
LSQTTKGSATGQLIFDVDKSGNNGNVMYNANVTGDVSSSQTDQVYYSNQVLSWSSMNGWTTDGSIAVQSQSVWYTFANWNASGSFNYGDNKYAITATENDFNSVASYSDIYSNEFYVTVSGGYGASSPLVW